MPCNQHEGTSLSIIHWSCPLCHATKTFQETGDINQNNSNNHLKSKTKCSLGCVTVTEEMSVVKSCEWCASSYKFTLAGSGIHSLIHSLSLQHWQGVRASAPSTVGSEVGRPSFCRRHHMPSAGRTVQHYLTPLDCAGLEHMSDTERFPLLPQVESAGFACATPVAFNPWHTPFSGGLGWGCPAELLNQAGQYPWDPQLNVCFPPLNQSCCSGGSACSYFARGPAYGKDRMKCIWKTAW